MKIKDIIMRCLRYAGREDINAKLTSGEELDGEQAEAVETLLYCVNAVEDELARCYFPLVTSESMKNSEGVYLYSLFMRKPVRIISVKSNGKDVKYTAEASKLLTDATDIKVKYEYSPDKKELDGVSELDGKKVNEKMLAAGAASEFFLINGEMQQAEFWDGVYNGEIDRVRRKGFAEIRFPDRRWV